MRSLFSRDILSLKDMEREEYLQIFSVADRLEPFAAERRNGDLLKHKTLLTAFYQPSTRTRLEPRLPCTVLAATCWVSRTRR